MMNEVSQNPDVSWDRKVSHSGNYPDWVCCHCGEKYGSRIPEMPTWHYGVCWFCAEYRPVTEARDFGHLNIGPQTGIVTP